VRVLSRNNNDTTGSFPELAELAGLLSPRRAVVDGEIVALEDGDRPSFARLQQRLHVAAPTPRLLTSVPVVYYVFDVLHLDGVSLLDEPYERRRALLADLALSGERIKTPAHFTGVDGQTVLKAAEMHGMEGVVSKRLASPYRPGRRSPDWVKTALLKTQEVLIVGWKPGEGRRAGTIGSLLLGVYDETDQLVFAGHVGTGFTDKALRHLHEQLTPLARSTAVVPDIPREHARHAHWVEPVLVGEVAFRNWTPDSRLRHPVWRGLRGDKPTTSVHRAPTPVPYPSQGTVEGAYQTRDGRWRVEVIRRGQDHFYRLVHGDNILDGLFIATVQRLLTEAGIDMADMTEAPVGESSRHPAPPGAA
jgi:bifunctional non-homologous end joining protein LigD